MMSHACQKGRNSPVKVSGASAEAGLTGVAVQAEGRGDVSQSPSAVPAAGFRRGSAKPNAAPPTKSSVLRISAASMATRIVTTREPIRTLLPVDGVTPNLTYYLKDGVRIVDDGAEGAA